MPQLLSAGAVGGTLATQLSPPVQLHQLLTAFQTDWTSWIAYGGMVVVLAAYAAGRRRLRRRGRQWSDWRTASFATGVAVVFVAIGSGVASYDDSNFVMHVVQHMLLMNVAPIFLALGAPITLALQSSSRPTQTGLLKVLHSRVVETLTFPVLTAAIGYGTMLIYFLTPLYALSERHPLLHDYVHLHFLVIGCLYWWPVVGLDPSRWKMKFPARLGYLATGVPINAMLGVALTLNRASIDPAINTLADTHRGGAILWGVSELLLLGGIAVMFIQWARQDAREASRFDRRLERELARDGERGLAGGVIMDPKTGLWHYPAESTPGGRPPS